MVVAVVVDQTATTESIWRAADPMRMILSLVGIISPHMSVVFV